MNFLNDSDFLDQHFLIDNDVINKFINICNLKNDDIVLEIGPGVGNISKLIKPKVKELYLIEKDERLKKYLNDFNVTFGDAIKIDYPKVNKIITSLPYSIIEPFIIKIIKNNINEIYMIMGSTYVNNVINNSITYLSLLTNSFYDATKYFDIPKECFKPMPRTISSVLGLKRKTNLTLINKIFQTMYFLSHKKVKNALMESLIKALNITKREAKEIILKLKIDKDILDIKFCLINNNNLKIFYDKIKTIESYIK